MPSLDPPSALPSSLGRALLHPWTWRMAWRDSRTQRKRLVIFALSIIAGISALVAIHSLEASARAGIAAQAKALLGSDLQISARHPFPPEAIARFTAHARRSSREIAFSSMVYFPTADAARLIEVRGVEGGFPFYGAVETSPPEAWQRLHAQSGIVVEPALLDQFKAKVGDHVRLGAIELPILGTVTKAAPRNGRLAAFSPEAYVRLDDLERTGLLGGSSLASYSVNLELSDPREERRLRAAFPDAAWHFETPKDRSASIDKALDNFQQYLGLMATAALVLGAIGVAGAVDSHIRRRTPVIAILRCLGCSRNLAFAVYLAQAVALGFFGAVAGALLGVAIHSGALTFFRHSLPIEIDAAPRWLVAAATTAAGFAVCCGFAFLPLLRVRHISPAAMLREDSPPGSRTRGFLRLLPFYLLPAVLLAMLSVIDTTHRRRAVGLTAGLCLAFVLLAGAAKVLVVVARKLIRPRWPYLLRQGISNLYRPHNQTLLFLLSLGLGVFLLVTVLLARNLLVRDLSVRDLADSPNIYLVDVQPDQLDGVAALIHSQKLPVLETAPIITVRIQSIKGVSVHELEKRRDTPKWVLQREFRSSYRDHLSSTEKLVAGTWIPAFSDSTAPAPLSLDEDIAKDLHVTVGDELVLDVQGISVRARVANLRKIDWSRFNLNFFMIFPRGVLEAAPGFDVVTTRVPAGTSSGDLQRALVQQFPNVSAIDLALILETVRSIVEKISRVVSILAGVTVLAGLPILVGTLLNGRDERIRESVLLRTLGASAGQIRIILLVEYATLGALSAVVGVLLAAAANYGLAVFVFDVPAGPDFRLLALACASATLLSILAGFALSRGVSRHPPLEILRHIA
jgi:putative ABC transport system permease protein